MTYIRHPHDVGNVIRSTRRQLKLTQQQLAQHAGVGRQSIVEIEGGKVVPTINVLLSILRVLRLDLIVRSRYDFDQPIPGHSAFDASEPLPDVDQIIDSIRNMLNDLPEGEPS